MKSCFFIGHRDAPLSLLPHLREVVQQQILIQNVCVFYVGYHGAFDRMATQVLIEAKTIFPHIHIYRVLAYHPSTHPVAIPDAFDGSYYPESMEQVPPRYAITRANHAMINQYDCLIAYCTHTTGNTHAFIRYAERKHKTVVVVRDTKEGMRCAGDA